MMCTLPCQIPQVRLDAYLPSSHYKAILVSCEHNGMHINAYSFVRYITTILRFSCKLLEALALPLWTKELDWSLHTTSR
jgi:hypothetical protein